MRHTFFSPLPLIGTLLLPCATSTSTSHPPGLEGENAKDVHFSKKLVMYWNEYACYEYNDHSNPPVYEQCQEACYPGGIKADESVNGVGCWLNGPQHHWNTGVILTEEELKEEPPFKTLTPGYCFCGNPIIDVFADFFIQAMTEIGKALERFMCPMLLALDVVIEIGSNAIPGVGKAITTGMKAAVKTAKMFKHAYDTADAALEWASMFVEVGFGLAAEAGCKKTFSFSKTQIAEKFLDFANAPDELVPDLNYDDLPCPKGKKASKICEKKSGDKDEDDDKEGDRDENNKDKENDKDNSNPTNTRKDDPKPTTREKNDPSSTKSQPSRTSSERFATSTSTAPTPKVDCAAIGRNDFRALLEDRSVGLKKPTKKRTVATTTSTQKKQTVQKRHQVKKRSFKKNRGYVCEGKRRTRLESKNYPTSSEKVMKDAPAYGFNKINDCGDYAFGEQEKANPRDYDTETVLEWSLVQNFFNILGVHPDFRNGFDHPNPENQGEESIDIKSADGEMATTKLGFCEYWAESWDWEANMTIVNPDPDAPAEDEPFRQTPLQWLAEAFPFIENGSPTGRKAHEGEFVLLQKGINEFPKTNMFSSNPTQEIYDDRDMEDLIKRRSKKKANKGKRKGQLAFGKPHEQPRAALQRMRAVVGLYLYLRGGAIDEIFVAQVDRIGNQLDHLENALMEQPKTVVNGDRTLAYNSWVHLNFKDKWFAYMDNVYLVANQKGQDFMEKNLKRLNDEYNDKKMIKQVDVDKEKNKKKKDERILEKQLREDMKKYISTLEKQWAEAKEWTKPGWNAEPAEKEETEEETQEELPAEETPVEEAPAEEVPAEEIPTEETPLEETPPEETPAAETPL